MNSVDVASVRAIAEQLGHRSVAIAHVLAHEHSRPAEERLGPCSPTCSDRKGSAYGVTGIAGGLFSCSSVASRMTTRLWPTFAPRCQRLGVSMIHWPALIEPV